MKIVSWNINGIRAVLKKGFLDYLKKDKPDLLCLQEVKINKKRQQEARFDFPGYDEIWNSAKRPGYSGTAVLVKEGLGYEVLEKLKYDDEGRAQIIDAGKGPDDAVKVSAAVEYHNRVSGPAEIEELFHVWVV